MRYFLFLSLLFPSLLWSNTRGITQVDLQIPQGERISLYKGSYALVIYSTSKPIRQFISAGSANQTVPAVSVFRPLFIRGINGAADLDEDGYVTGVELGMYLQRRKIRWRF
jgi:hypothetical protein